MHTRPHPFLIGFACLVFFFLLAPLVIIIGASVSDTTFLTFPPQGLTLHWYENIFEVSAFKRTMVTSFILAVTGTSLSLIVGIPAAYALNRYRVQLPSFLSTVFVLPILVPEIVLGFSLMKTVTTAMGFPIFVSLVIGHALLVLPYCVRVVSAALASFDFSIEEAAVSLGCPRWKAFFIIVLPNPADPASCPYGAVLRPHHRFRFRAFDARDGGCDGGCRTDAGAYLSDEMTP